MPPIMFRAVGPVGAGPVALSPIGLIPSSVPASSPFRGEAVGLPGGIAIPSRPAVPSAGQAAAPAWSSGAIMAAIPAVRAPWVILNGNDRGSRPALNASCRWSPYCDHCADGSSMSGHDHRAGERGAGHKPNYFHDRLTPFYKANRNSPRHEYFEDATGRTKDAAPPEKWRKNGAPTSE